MERKGRIKSQSFSATRSKYGVSNCARRRCMGYFRPVRLGCRTPIGNADSIVARGLSARSERTGPLCRLCLCQASSVWSASRQTFSICVQGESKGRNRATSQMHGRSGSGAPTGAGVCSVVSAARSIAFIYAFDAVYFDAVYCVMAFVPSATACLANSPGNIRRQAV